MNKKKKFNVHLCRNICWLRFQVLEIIFETSHGSSRLANLFPLYLVGPCSCDTSHGMILLKTGLLRVYGFFKISSSLSLSHE